MRLLPDLEAKASGTLSFADCLDDAAQDDSRRVSHVCRAPACLARLEWPRRRPLTAAAAVVRRYGEGSHAAVAAANARPLEDEVAEELALSPGLSRRQLERLRRRFASANHPDRYEGPIGDLACHRMQIANRMIDEALRLAL